MLYKIIDKDFNNKVIEVTTSITDTGIHLKGVSVYETPEDFLKRTEKTEEEIELTFSEFFEVYELIEKEDIYMWLVKDVFNSNINILFKDLENNIKEFNVSEDTIKLNFGIKNNSELTFLNSELIEKEVLEDYNSWISLMCLATIYKYIGGVKIG